MCTWTKENILQFIELYRAKPCLWQIKSKDYSNRYIKEKAYDSLVQYVQRFDKAATRELVLKKINNLRTTYRKELKKVEASKLSGLDLYVPSLWYYPHLLFLNDQETPRQETSSIDALYQETNSANQDSDFQIVKCETEIEAVKETGVDTWTDQLASESPVSPSSTYSQAVSQTSTSLLKTGHSDNSTQSRKRKAEDEVLWQLAKDSPENLLREDEHDTFGKTVAFRLRKLPAEQQLHAEKFISDVLYEAGFGNLSRNTRLVL